MARSPLALFGGPPARPAPPEPRPRITAEEAADVARSLAAVGDWSRAGDDWPSPYLEPLEARWAELHHAAYAVAVSSGTAALALALGALRIPPGDEVLIPAYGCPAVDAAVFQAGLTPVHVDLDPRTYGMAPAAAAAAITPRTAALVVVHWAGQPAGRDGWRRLAERNGLALLEDACLAPGAQYGGEPVGAWGAAAVFSLGVRKPLSAGEGGFVVTRDPKLAERVRRDRSLGADPESGDLRRPTGNYRLSEWAAGVTLPQLARLEAGRSRRAASARLLSEAVERVPFLEPLALDPRTNGPTWAQLWLRFDEEAAGIPRARWVEALQAEGVPIFPGWGRPSYTLGMYTRAGAAEWLRARESGRPPDFYERVACRHAERAAYSEALVLDLPVLEDEAVGATASALEKVAANVHRLR